VFGLVPDPPSHHLPPIRSLLLCLNVYYYV